MHTAAALAIVLCAGAPAAPAGELRAGAARIDITPAQDGQGLVLSGYRSRRGLVHAGIRDPLHVRALVLDDGTARAAVVTLDLIAVGHAFFDAVAERIAAAAEIPRENLLVAATHTHGAPAVGAYGAVFPADSAQGRYLERVEDAVVESVRAAAGALAPARLGFGAGRANVNANRRAIGPDGRSWLGIDLDRPSDKTLAVVAVETANGEPIALLVNFAVHGTGMGGENLLVTGDIPGATSRFVEERLGGRAVALWSSGAAGDQCPIYDRHPSRFAGVDAIGRILGEEALRVAAGIETTAEAAIRGAQSTVTCPGHRFVAAAEGSSEGTFEDAPPVEIRLAMLRAGEIALGGVSGEVLTMIGQRFKREAAAPEAMMITHANGASEYLPDDAAFDELSYEIRTSRVKRGCAEDAIVGGLLRLLRETGAAAGKPPGADPGNDATRVPRDAPERGS